MKLPQVTYRGVQSLGRNDTNSVRAESAATKAQSDAFQAMTGAIARVSADYIERQENQEYNEQIASYHVEMREWQARHGAKAYFSEEEIPESLRDSGEIRLYDTVTDDAGVESQVAREAIPAFEVYPHLLSKKLEGLIAEKADKISNPRMRNAFIEKARMNAADTVMNAAIVAEQNQRSYNIEKGTTEAMAAADSGNLAMAQFIIENIEDLDPVDAKKFAIEAERRVEVYEVTQAIRSTDRETIATMQALLDDPNYSGLLSEAQRKNAIADLKARDKFLNKEFVQDRLKQNQIFISDSFVGIEQGTFTLRDVEAGYELWKRDDTNPQAIDPATRLRMRNAINARNKAMQEQQDWMSMGQQIIANGGNKDNPDHRKAVNAVVEGEDIKDPMELVDIAVKTGGIMPQRLKDFMTTAALHNAENGAETIPVALSAYNSMIDAEMHLGDDLGKEADWVLGDAALLTRTGMKPMEAYEIARENARLEPELREAREQAYKALKPVETNLDALQGLMDDDTSLFGFEQGLTSGWDSPAANDQIFSQFSGATQVHYMRTGNIALAQTRAWQDIKARWSPTGTGAIMLSDDLGENEIKADVVRPMELPPERVYGISSEESNTRLRMFAEAEDLPFEKLMIVSDNMTKRQGKDYAVMVLDTETGFPVPHAKRWNPGDWKEEAAEWNRQKAIEIQLQKERDEAAARMFKDPRFGAMGFGQQIDEEYVLDPEER